MKKKTRKHLLLLLNEKRNNLDEDKWSTEKWLLVNQTIIYSWRERSNFHYLMQT